MIFYQGPSIPVLSQSISPLFHPGAAGLLPRPSDKYNKGALYEFSPHGQRQYQVVWKTATIGVCPSDHRAKRVGSDMSAGARSRFNEKGRRGIPSLLNNRAIAVRVPGVGSSPPGGRSVLARGLGWLGAAPPANPRHTAGGATTAPSLSPGH